MSSLKYIIMHHNYFTYPQKGKPKGGAEGGLRAGIYKIMADGPRGDGSAIAQHSHSIRSSIAQFAKRVQGEL